MIIGTHNSFTGSKIYGWQRYISWLLNPFSKCQKDSIFSQYNRGVRLFDIQIAKHQNKWRASHGFVWYQATIEDLYELIDIVKDDNEIILLRIGLDNHWRFGKHDDIKEELDFLDLVNKLNDLENVRIVEVYKEKPWHIIYRSPAYTGVSEYYWSISWAKSKMKHWWQFYYFIPIPWLWYEIYVGEWFGKSIKDNANIYLSDFQ